MNKKASKLLLLGLACVVILVLAMGIGSVSIAPLNTAKIILKNTLGTPFIGIDEVEEAILWKLRIPRTVLAFVCGSGLALSGVMMQSVLKNPLASSYTLGVSSGASLGASVAMVFGISLFGFFTLPLFGLTAGLVTVFLALGVASRIDRSMQSNSIILTGMAFSLFASAVVTILMSFSRDEMQRLIYWQMGSFAVKSPAHLWVLLPTVVGSLLLVLCYARQMDIMTLGDEQAQTSGVNSFAVRVLLLSVGSVVTGVIVSLVGIIGFVDLFIPHMARKLFGASHKYVLPASVLLGGAFMVLCDLVARTIVAPVELPVGAITAAVGAPFFIYLYLSRRKRAQ